MKLLKTISLLRSHIFRTTTRFSSVDYTWKNFHVDRRKNINKVSDADISFFKDLLPERAVTDAQELEIYNTDWLKLFRGMSQVMLKPKTTQEVSEIMKYCNKRMLAVCPQGGNTGLVGGSVPVFDEVIINMSLMNRVKSVDSVSGTVVCDAGVILENLETYLHDYNLIVPLDLGAKGSCHIGGNVSTNAGGLRYLRYGTLHGNVLGVEVVLADGRILDCLSTLKKDNTGYDLKQLFIGAEGTLGIITAVSLAVPQKPSSLNLSFLAVNSYAVIKDIFVTAKEMLGEIMSAFEFLDFACIDSVTGNLGLKCPIAPEYPFYVLVETSGSNGDHDAQKLDAFLEHVMDKGMALDGTVATEPSKMHEIWKVRESVAEALLHDGDGCFKYDLSIPLESLYGIVEVMREQFGHRANRIVGYGHFGDGNIHMNVVAPTYDKQLLSEIEPIIFEYTKKHSGSISAEHGVGFKKAKQIHFSRKPENIEVMKQLKDVFDPKGILNPYKMLPW